MKLGISMPSSSLCFHCQQAAEKYLKAYIIYLSLHYEKVHDLKYLLNIIEKRREVSNKLKEYAALLNEYTIDSRYPDYWQDPTLSETKECIKAANHFKKYINEVFKNIK
ncbi:MAG: HEPN domain-containing protein [Candidatus Izemoplasmatales bacterium]